VEVPLYAWSLRGRPMERRIAIAFGASAVTHPIVWLVIAPAFFPPDPLPGGWLAMAAAAESFAVAVEAVWLRAFGTTWRRAAVWALVANGASFGAGQLSRELVGWP